MKRNIALLLAVLMLASSMVSCSESGTANTDTSTNNETANTESVQTADGETATETVEEEADDNSELFASLPTNKYDGYTFNILNNESNFAITQVVADEMTGEAINDAIYKRNIMVEDLLDIKIAGETVPYGTVTSTMNTSIPAGDDTYQIFFNESKFVAPFAVKGYLLDVNKLDEINTSNPWWNTGVLNQVTFNNHLYFLVGDLHLMFNESYWMLGFNKQLLDNLSLTDPYEQVREGTWTLDVFYNDMVAAAEDLNGDGTTDAEDRFGLACYDQVVLPLVFGTGVTLTEDDGTGHLVFKSGDDLLFSTYEKVSNIFKNKPLICADAFVDISIYKGSFADTFHGAFISGHTLFYSDPIGSLKKFREMDYEFGIVPYPKLDETQANYVSYIASYAAFGGLPITNGDPSRTATILENLAAYSSTDMKEAYRTTTLDFKYVRDKESIEMLDIILSTGEIRISEILDCTTISTAIRNGAYKGEDSIASTIQKSLKAGNKLLDKSISSLIGE